MSPIFLFVIIGIGVVAVVAWLNHLGLRRRREEMAALADELGWSFDPGHDTLHDEQYAQFEIFRRGHSRAAHNTLQGAITLLQKTCPARMGDFTYKVTSGSGKNRRTTTYRFSYLIVHPPLQRLPALLIRPEGMFDKIAGAFGFDDIDFESAEFSRRFFVKSDDKRFAYGVIDPRMMDFLLRSRPPMVDLEHDCCCVSDGRQRWTPDQFNAMLGWVEEFYNHWPRHVIDAAARYAG